MYVNTQLGCCGSRCQCAPRSRRQRGTRLGSLGLGPFAAAVGPAAPGLLTNPVGIAITAGLTLISVITKIFGAHAAAVAREANTLNQAVPAYVTGLQAIFAAANSGQISAQQALALVDEAVQTYYQQVGSIMKKGGTCPINSDCSYPGGSKAGNVPFDNCNGPCSVGCNYVEPSACVAKMVLTQGGTMMTPSSPAHAGYNGAPSQTLSYQPPVLALPPSVSNVIAPVQQAIAAVGLPSWVLPVAGGLLAAKLVGVI
jgi:hypothetical protein